MSVWILRLPFTLEEEQSLLGQSTLFIPFKDVPDLSSVRSLDHCKALMKKIHPDAPPEKIQIDADALWSIHGALQKDDTIAVYLPHSKKVVLSRVMGNYQYSVSEQGEDIHTIGVTWYKPLPLHRFAGHKKMLTTGAEGIFEVKDAKQRAAFTDKLPYSYNRFNRINWLLVGVVIIKIVAYFLHQMGAEG